MTYMDDPLLRRREVLAITKMSKSSLCKKMSRRLFPQPISLGPRMVRWRSSEVHQWIASRPVA